MTYGLAICAGGGGLELGLSIVLGDSHRVVCYVEREAYATATLVTRMEEGALDSAPVWDDLTTFTGDVVSPFVGRIDLLSGGIPCQPHSTAGKRLGAEDSRDLWPQTARLIREVRPGRLFLENVPGIARYYWERIRPELHDMGYATEEGIFSAAEVGANHRRERFFLLAYSGCFRIQEQHRRATGASRARAPESTWDGENGDVADATSEPSDGSNNHGRRKPKPISESQNSAEAARRECGWWAVEPDVDRVADRVAQRVDRLAMLGNGVVPLQAAYAFRTLNAALAKRGLTC